MEQGPWGLSPLRPDPSSLPGAGVLLSSPLPLLLPTSPRPLPPSPGPAPTKVDEVAGAAAESCARSSCRDAGPVGEQGSHQVHVLVHDGYVQCSLTWPRESSQSWGLSPVLLGTQHPPGIQNVPDRSWHRFLPLAQHDGLVLWAISPVGCPLTVPTS